MKNWPHVYLVSTRMVPVWLVVLTSPGLTTLASAPPKEFDGPGDKWSPETLLTAAMADCFALSFRAVAAASKFEWTQLECDVEGTLDRIERVKKLLEKSEQVCLISASLKAAKQLVMEVVSRSLAIR